MGIVCILLQIYSLILLVWVVSSWVAAFPGQAGSLGRRVNRLLSPFVEPVLRPFRNLLPALRMGAMGLDLSPLILFVVIQVIQLSIC
jgi:YggT family protein